MEPQPFPQANKTWKAPPGMENCVDLETFSDGDVIVSHWKMTWRERFSALFFGRVWHYAWCARPAPVGIMVRKSIFPKE